jgi:hypothetical protein
MAFAGAVSSRFERFCSIHDRQHQAKLGKRFPPVSLNPRLAHPRHDRLRLVDESHPGARGPVFLAIDPCRYRLSDSAADGDPAGVAMDQSAAGIAG